MKICPKCAAMISGGASSCPACAQAAAPRPAEPPRKLTEELGLTKKGHWLTDIIWAVGIFAAGCLLIFPIFFLLFNAGFVLFFCIGAYGFIAALCEFAGARVFATLIAGVILPQFVAPLAIVMMNTSTPTPKPSEAGGLIFIFLLGAMQCSVAGWFLGFIAVRSAYGSTALLRKFKHS